MADQQRNSNNNNNSKKQVDNDTFMFRHSFAAALAKALRENDDAQQQQRAAAAAAARMQQQQPLPKTWDERTQLAHSTYKWLCHDEPNIVVAGNGLSSSAEEMAMGCDCLREALLLAPSSSSSLSAAAATTTTPTTRTGTRRIKQYALSHRLVNGLHQVLASRQLQQQQEQQQHDSQNNEPTSTPPPPPGPPPVEQTASLLLRPTQTTTSSTTTTTTARAMAKLAFSIHLQIPWLCLQESSSSSALAKNNNKNNTCTGNENDKNNNDDNIINNNKKKKNVIAQWLGSYRVQEDDKQSTSRTTLDWFADVQQQQQQHSSILRKEDDAAAVAAAGSGGNDTQRVPTTTTTTTGAPQSTNNPFNNGHHDNNNNNNNSQDHDMDSSSLQEVWAAESDPSDYEYDSGALDYQAQLQELDQWATQLQLSVDPHHLSQPPAAAAASSDEDKDDDDANKQKEWKTLAQSVGQLLRSVSYSPHLVALPTNEWTTIIDVFWMPLILTLLVPTAAASSRQNALLQAMPVAYWQHTGLHVLHILRDATLDGLSKHNGDNYYDDYDNSRLTGYVQVLQQLLQVQMAQEEDDKVMKNGNIQVDTAMATMTTKTTTARTTTTTTMPSISSSHVAPASWIGLSLFSALCSTVVSNANNKTVVSSTTTSRTHHNINVSLKTIRQLQTCVLESCDDLSLLLERSLSDTTCQVRTALQWTYLSFFQILLLQNGTAADNLLSTRNANTAQTLLQSGLFRQWLSHWAKQEQAKTDDNKNETSMDILAVQRAVEDSVLKVCATNPTLLGKYAWRFPNFAATVTAQPKRLSDTSNAVDTCPVLVDSLLWNLLGVQLAGNSGTTSTLRSVQLKGKLGFTGSTASKPAPSVEECRQVAWAAFQELCQQTHLVLTEWRNDIEKSVLSQGVNVSVPSDNNIDADADKFPQESKACSVAEFGRLVSRLMEFPLLGNMFVSQMAPSMDGKTPRTMIETALYPVRQVLKEWPKAATADISSKVKVDDDDDDEVNDGNKDQDKDDLQQGKVISSRYALRNQAVCAMRRDIKQLATLLLDSGSSAERTANGSTKVAYVSSSKAD